MSALEDINTMRQAGKTDIEIQNELQAKGVSSQEALNLIAQSRIREAVTGTSQQQEQPEQQVFNEQNLRDSIKMGKDNNPNRPASMEEGMEQSMLSQPEQAPPSPQEPMTQEYYAPGDNSQQYYQPYQQASASTESISEIAEQIVAEHFTKLSSKLHDGEKIQAIAEAKLSIIDERLKRIEKIIDKLQLSILQKVGEYVTNVEDIKREVIETQKTFKAVLNDKKADHNRKLSEHHKG